METRTFICEGSPYQTHKDLIRYSHKVSCLHDFKSKEEVEFGECSQRNQALHMKTNNSSSMENNISTNGVDAILADTIQPKYSIEYATPSHISFLERSMSSMGRRSPALFHDEHRFKVATENRLTRISLCIVYLFIFCHIWRLIPTIYEALFSEDGTVLSNWPKWLFHVYHLSHTLIVFNSAANFILYVVG